MTSRPTTLTARTIGETENALQAILRKSLDDSGLEYHDWIALKLVSEIQPPITRKAAVEEMVNGLKVSEEAATQVIDGLQAEDVLTQYGDHHLTTTSQGTALYQDLNEKIGSNARRMWDGITPDDLVTAYQVLTTIKDRANAILGSGT